MMQSAISQGVSIGILLVLHSFTIFFIDNSKGQLLAFHRIFLRQSPPCINSVHLSGLNINYMLFGIYLGQL